MSFLFADGISAGYGKQTVIGSVSFRLDEGLLMGVIGANGSGKTTLLKSLCGILPHQGRCTLDGTVLETLSPRQIAKTVSYIPQRSGISIDISALDVVLMGFNPYLGLLESPSVKMRDAAVGALEQVGLGGRAETNYLHLSEGQKQLCILARTLVSEGKLLLLDEPESALDFRFRHRMLSLLRGWVSSGKRSAIVALHDPGLALNFCHKLLVLGDEGGAEVIDLRSDPLDKTEQVLSGVYGSISLQRCKNRRGEDCIVILREGEE